MIIYTPAKPAESIPVIDLAESGSLEHRKRIAWEIHKACRDTGFFYVANHGVPNSVLTDQLAWAERFFELPFERKLEINFDQSPRRLGYEPMLRQVLDEGSAPDLKESFMCLALPPDVSEREAYHDPLNLWPAGLPGFEAQTRIYGRHMGILCRRLMALIALSLDLSEDYFEDAFAGTTSAVRMLHYPPQGIAGAHNQLGAGAHTDWGAITLLLQDECGGLEVRNAAGDWIEATPIPGTLVINLGDLIRRWTNDLYHSTLHRVLNKAAGRHRYSVPTFCSPDHSYRVECLPTCRPSSGVPLYPVSTVGEHMKEMATRTYTL